jgi:hypothetical protein
MASPTNITNITPPRVPFIDQSTGLISRQWYRFLLNMFTITGNGTQQPTLGIAVAPPLTVTDGQNPEISITGSALTRIDDTNVTLTLGGSAATALLAPATIAAGWSGILDASRGGTGPWTTTGGVQVTQGVGITPAISNTPTPFGYLTGAGGVVTQSGGRTAGVTINKPTGAITLFSAAGSATPATFTVTNSVVAATDVVILSVKSGASNYYSFNVNAVGAGGFSIAFWAQSGTAVDAPVINFVVLKGAAS